jgi:hypothetical protein
MEFRICGDDKNRGFVKCEKIQIRHSALKLQNSYSKVVSEYRIEYHLASHSRVKSICLVIAQTQKDNHRKQSTDYI